jgi:hypothetical protein
MQTHPFRVYLLTLHKCRQYFAARLQQWVADYDPEELLQPGSAGLDHVVAEAVGEHLAGQRGDGDAGALALQDVTEVLEVRVTAAYAALAQLEGRDVGAADYLVVGVHVPADPVRSRIADLPIPALASAFTVALAILLHLGVPRQSRKTGHRLGKEGLKAEGGEGGGQWNEPRFQGSSPAAHRSRRTTAGAYLAWIA